MKAKQTERAMQCLDCGRVVYPQICPSVIVGITDDSRILMTKYASSHSNYKKYALVAGYAEIGESLENTVAREVMEEVGLKVKNIRYYKSQPWSFSDALLVGFFCEVDGNAEIKMDTEELSAAEWFERCAAKRTFRSVDQPYRRNDRCISGRHNLNSANSCLTRIVVICIIKNDKNNCQYDNENRQAEWRYEYAIV